MASSVLTVSGLTRYLKASLESDPVLSSVTVEGEIVNFHRHTSGHLYFSLTDSVATIRAVMFRARAATLRILPASGQKVLCTGYVSLYEQGGQLELYVERMEPAGVGAKLLELEALRERLKAEGLFDERRKRPLPRLPRRVGVITSPTGAAIHDILKVLRRRYPGISVLVRGVLVQGAGAPRGIVEALDLMGQRADVDVIILGRGGGASEDLDAFNDEAVVRAVAHCPHPVIAAVGHESDVTLTDFAADHRAPTPSAAAELAVPEREQLHNRVHELDVRLRRSLLVRRRRAREELWRLVTRGALAHPRRLVAPRRERLDRLWERLVAAVLREKEREDWRASSLARRLEALDPDRVLARGYAIVEDTHGRAVGRAAQARRLERLELRFVDGRVRARVEGDEP